MNEAGNQGGDVQKEIEYFVSHMFGEYGWLFVVAFVIVLFQSSIKKLVASIFVFAGNDYKADDVVYIDGKPGRIIRVGFTKTVFFLYDVHDGNIVGGSKLVIQNDNLGKLKIEKPLPELDLSRLTCHKKN